MNDPYEVLGVHPNVAPQVLRVAYLSLAQEHHPEKGGSPERMSEVAAAWYAVRDVRGRRKTDDTLKVYRKMERPACGKCKGRGLVPARGVATELACPVCKGAGLPVGKQP